MVVFASHRDGDHYDKIIWDWKKTVKRITYVLGWEPAMPQEKYVHIQPWETGHVGDIEVTTLPSTDSGESFLIKVDGLVIYHSGDNAFWMQSYRPRYMKQIDWSGGKTGSRGPAVHQLPAWQRPAAARGRPVVRRGQAGREVHLPVAHVRGRQQIKDADQGRAVRRRSARASSTRKRAARRSSIGEGRFNEIACVVGHARRRASCCRRDTRGRRPRPNRAAASRCCIGTCRRRRRRSGISGRTASP